MSENFEINNKLLGLKGVLNRRDFIINCVVIKTIEMFLLFLPLFYDMFLHPKTMLSILEGETIPLRLIIWALAYGIVSVVLYYPSILRRIRDILREDNESKTKKISVFVGLVIFLGCFFSVVNIAGSIVMVFLACKPGKDVIKAPFNKRVAILTPILVIVTSLVINAFAVFGIFSYSKTHPEFVKDMKNLGVQMLVKSVNSRFDKIEFDGGQYKFYLNPVTWDRTRESLKESMFVSTAMYVYQNDDKLDKDKIAFSDIMNNVKILSTFNNEVLAEYYIEPAKAQELKKNLKDKKITEDEYRLEITKSEYFRFNNYPSMP